MQVEIQATNFPLKSETCRYVLRCLSCSFRRTRENLQHIAIRLFDLTGPIRGVDQSCLVEIRMPGQSYVLVGNTERNLNPAVYRVIEDVRRLVLRRIKMQRSRNHWRFRWREHLEGQVEFAN